MDVLLNIWAVTTTILIFYYVWKAYSFGAKGGVLKRRLKK